MSKTRYAAIPDGAKVCPDGMVKIKALEGIELLVGRALPDLYTAAGAPAMEIPEGCPVRYPGLYRSTPIADLFDLHLDKTNHGHGLRIGYYYTVMGMAGRLGIYPLLVSSFGFEAADALLDLVIHELVTEYNRYIHPLHTLPRHVAKLEREVMRGHMGFSMHLPDADWYERFLSGKCSGTSITEKGIRHFLQAWKERAQTVQLNLPDRAPIVEYFTEKNLLACVRLLEGDLFLALRRDAPLRGLPLAYQYCPCKKPDAVDLEQVLAAFQAQGIPIGGVIGGEEFFTTDFLDQCEYLHLEYLVKVVQYSDEFMYMVSDHYNEYCDRAEERDEDVWEYVAGLGAWDCSQELESEEAMEIWLLYDCLAKVAFNLTAILQTEACPGLRQGAGLQSLCFCTFLVSIFRSVLGAMSASEWMERQLILELNEIACAPIDGTYHLVGKPKYAMDAVLRPLGITRAFMERISREMPVQTEE